MDGVKLKSFGKTQFGLVGGCSGAGGDIAIGCTTATGCGIGFSAGVCTTS